MVASVAVAATLLLVGLDQALRDLDTYTADLTTGHGDFVTHHDENGATSYHHDGFHLTVRTPETWVPSGVRTGTKMRSISVEIAATSVRTPAGAGFGPFCWHDPTHGYGFTVDGRGRQQLVHVDGSASHDVSVLASAPGTTAGFPARVRLVCTIEGSPLPVTVHLAGYVGDTKTIAATTDVVVADFRASGFSGHTQASSPAEWRVTRFWRRGPSELESAPPGSRRRAE